MIFRLPIISLKKLYSSLPYVLVLLSMATFSGNAGHTADLPTETIHTEVVFSASQQVQKTLTWQKALSASNVTKFWKDHVNFASLSRLHDRLLKVARTYLLQACTFNKEATCFVQQKTIPLSSSELPHSLPIM